MFEMPSLLLGIWIFWFYLCSYATSRCRQSQSTWHLLYLSQWPSPYEVCLSYTDQNLDWSDGWGHRPNFRSTHCLRHRAALAKSQHHRKSIHLRLLHSWYVLCIICFQLESRNHGQLNHKNNMSPNGNIQRNKPVGIHIYSIICLVSFNGHLICQMRKCFCLIEYVFMR